MSEEEINAIEYLNKYIKSDLFYEQEHYNRIKIVLNLINKLQKENEELKEKLKSKEKQIKLMQEMNLPDEIEKNYISKDKIRNKIKELDKKRNYIHSMYTSNVLEELLGDK